MVFEVFAGVNSMPSRLNADHEGAGHSGTPVDHVCIGMAAAPLLRPQVEDVVQVDVGKQRRDHRTLSPTPMLEELHQPGVIDSVEEPVDVCIERPVHAFRLHAATSASSA